VAEHSIALPLYLFPSIDCYDFLLLSRIIITITIIITTTTIKIPNPIPALNIPEITLHELIRRARRDRKNTEKRLVFFITVFMYKGKQL